MKRSGNSGPSRAWFILPSALLLAGALLAGFGVSSFAGFVGSDFYAYQPGSSISVTEAGITLYAEQGTRGATSLSCTATGPDGPVPLPSSFGTTLSNEHGRFVGIASTPGDLPAGRYVISCKSASGGPDVSLWVGPIVDFGAVMLVVVFALATVFLGFCSVVLFAILIFLRARSRRITSATVRDGQPL